MATPDRRAIAVIRQYQEGRSINQYARDLAVDPAQLWRVLKGEQGADSVLLKLMRKHPEYAEAIATALEQRTEVPA